MNDVCWEIVVSKAKAGVTREQVVALGAKIQDWARAQPGFLDRKLVEDVRNATWIDVVTWRSAADAHRAAAAMGSAPCMADVAALLDETSLAIFHGSAVPLPGQGSAGQV